MIKVSEKLFINADSKNYILQNKVISKGEERMEAIGFYTSLEDLLYGIIKHDLRKFISKYYHSKIFLNIFDTAVNYNKNFFKGINESGYTFF